MWIKLRLIVTNLFKKWFTKQVSESNLTTEKEEKKSPCSVTFELIGDKYHATTTIEDGYEEYMAELLVKINSGVFNQPILDSIKEDCDSKGEEQIYDKFLLTFTKMFAQLEEQELAEELNKYNQERPLVNPSEVFKQ